MHHPLKQKKGKLKKNIAPKQKQPSSPSHAPQSSPRQDAQTESEV
jgi:hypothetical protein